MSWGISLTGMGNVLSLLDNVRTRWSGDTLYLVGPTVSYAVFQERGTSSLQARPFMQPAAERVQSNMASYADQYAPGGINSEAALIQALALAVQNESKRIANQKGVRDTGALINSITIQKVG